MVFIEKKKYHMDLIRSFFSDLENGKFKVGSRKLNDTIKEDSRYQIVYNWLYEKYVVVGMGFKSIIKDFKLPICYSMLRQLIKFIGFKIHSNTDANIFLRKKRSDIAKDAFIKKTGFFKDGVQENIHAKRITRGIQGYYWNSSKGKYVWLRSSWEFIYAKWLNSHRNTIWDVEVEQYNLGETSYRPDFFIYDSNGNVTSIVEVKGYWKNRLYKVGLLKEQISVPITVVDDIRPYCQNNLNEEIKLWKSIRKLKLEQ